MMKKTLNNLEFALRIFLYSLLIAMGCKKDEGMEKVSDADGNIYNSVKIGSQIWLLENLKTTRYNDGTPISLITDNSQWSTNLTSAFCWYNNDINFKDPYGALYNWYAVNTGKVCPTGWHVPSNEEMAVLSTYLGGDDKAGGKLKEEGTEHWIEPNVDATNESGFTALPAGYRGVQGNFNQVGNYTCFWSSAELNENEAWFREVYGWKSDFTKSEDVKLYGFSIRCIKD